MKIISKLIFRRLSPADFYHINKEPQQNSTGGGQSYIDIPTRNVPIHAWSEFLDVFQNLGDDEKPYWRVDISSVGLKGSQIVTIGVRRSASVNIRSQKLHSDRSNRIRAWHPDLTDFPQAPKHMTGARDPRVIRICDGLLVMIAKTTDREYWAMWQDEKTNKEFVTVRNTLGPILENSAGLLEFDKPILLNNEDPKNPFCLESNSQIYIAQKSKTQTDRKKPKSYNNLTEQTDSDLARELFSADFSTRRKISKKTQKIYSRNVVASRRLKLLYKQCQITGNEFVFEKVNGEPYLEVHHLIPLGEGGADQPANLIVVSAHIHRMLHYGTVSEINIANVRDGKLNVKINGKNYIIKWHSDHERCVKESM